MRNNRNDELEKLLEKQGQLINIILLKADKVSWQDTHSLNFFNSSKLIDGKTRIPNALNKIMKLTEELSVLQIQENKNVSKIKELSEKIKNIAQDESQTYNRSYTRKYYGAGDLYNELNEVFKLNIEGLERKLNDHDSPRKFTGN